MDPNQDLIDLLYSKDGNKHICHSGSLDPKRKGENKMNCKKPEQNQNNKKLIDSLIAITVWCLCLLILTGTVCLICVMIKNTSDKLSQKMEEPTTITIVDNTTISEFNNAVTTTAQLDLSIETSEIENPYKRSSGHTDGIIYAITPEDISFLKYIDGERTDIDDDQLEYIINVGNDMDINPYLIATIIYIESRGKSDVYNDGGYRGYGGIGEEAGKFMYEDVLELGSYDHDMAFDPYVNILLIATTLNYLMSEEGYGYDIYRTLQFYSGSGGEWGYINKASERLNETNGPTLDEIYLEFINKQEE